MALVAYDYASGSEPEEDEEDESQKSSVVIPPKPTVQQNGVQPSSSQDKSDIDSIVDDDPPPTTSGLFSKLPETKSVSNEIAEGQIEDFIPKSKPVKERQKVKITIPSLSEFASLDDDEPVAKKAKPAGKGSSLLSLLPPVKGSVLTAKSFVPNSVAKKPNSQKPSTTNSLVPNSVRLKAEAKKKAALDRLTKAKAAAGSDAESDDEFEMPETFDDDMWQKLCGRPSKPKEIITEPEPVVESVNIAPEPEKPYDGLDNQAFKELVGKTKRPVGNIRMIDINEEEILPEKDIWMTRALTDPEMEQKPEEETVDPTKRKKHHITYLAQQAKANEQDLKTQWATSRNNRLQSRAKYGF